MVPLLTNYSLGITKSVSQFLQKEDKFVSYMNAILEAHFSDPIHTVDELGSFLAYNFKAPSPAAKPLFPRTGLLDYLISVFRSIEFFYDCAFEVMCYTIGSQFRMSSTSSSRAMAALLRLQLYAELFHRPTGYGAVFQWNNQEQPGMTRLVWGTYSETGREECQYISATLIQWLEHKVEEHKLGPRAQEADGKCYLLGLPQLHVLLYREPHTEREREYACQLLEHGLGAFYLVDDPRKRVDIIKKTYKKWYRFEYMPPAYKETLLKSLAKI